MSQNQKNEIISNRNRKVQYQQQDVENTKLKTLSETISFHQKSNGELLTKQKFAKVNPNEKAVAIKYISRKKSQPNNQKFRERAERECLVLWRRPSRTAKYCFLEVVTLIQSSTKRLLEQRIVLPALTAFGIILCVTYYIPGPHQLVLDNLRKNIWFSVYWIGLGVLSSVGLGTGLHTFLLYLGPHIAKVTLAAYECNSLNFPKPPYPEDIICPEEPYAEKIPNIWTIMSKVRLEAFLWGAGTALGELPPYFMAKAARLSGYDASDVEEMTAFEELNAKRYQKNLSLVDKGKLFMERVVERIGFFGILACASIPNPLFDLAGITCGHFLVPFWTFFGATLIGKAIIKMHLQKIFVIIAFNETLIEHAVHLMGHLPILGSKLQEPFKIFLENQKQRLHRQKNGPPTDSANLISLLFECFVVSMVCYFVISIINSLAQSYHKRIHKKPLKKAQKTPTKN